MKKYIAIFIFCLLVSSLQSQTAINEDKKTTEYSNLVKTIWFLSQENYYPLTIEISPYGYWFVGDIYLGHNAHDINEYLRYQTFGWGIDGCMVDTPNDYIYDTVTADTIHSIFNNVMCINNTPKLPLNFLYKNRLINISDSSSYAEMIKEIQYTLLFSNIALPQDSCEIIRCVYPINVYYPYKTSFAVVVLKVWSDKIEMISSIINSTNLLDLKTEKIGNVILEKRDYKRLQKRLSRTSFNKKIDCSCCFSSPLCDFEYVIEYKNKEINSSYFLCENFYLRNLDKSQKKIINYLSGLYHSVYQLNGKYFSVVRKVK